MRYLISSFRKIERLFRNRFILLLMDYDGTLSPIAQTPQKAVLSRDVKGLLQKLSARSYCKVGIISGRELKDIKKTVGLNNIIYSGNHGLQLEGPQIKFEPFISTGHKTLIKQIKFSLLKKIAFVKGAFIEDKGVSLALHYRLADKAKSHLLKTIFHETVIRYLVQGKIKIRPGKKVLEVIPNLEWNKGRVALWLLARQQFICGDNKVLPVYLGDDATDEDAFNALKRKGLTVFVGSRRDSSANYYLKNTGEVITFLRFIAEFKDYARTNNRKRAF